jgi:hypothetical protein
MSTDVLPIATPIPAVAAKRMSMSRALHEMNLRSALRAGLVGAVAITVYMFAVPRALGIPQMDIGIIVGAVWFDPTYGPLYWLGWTLWHMVNGIAYVIPFAIVVWLIRQITTRLLGVWWQSDVFMGFVYGAVLWSLGPMTSIPSMLAGMPELTRLGLTNPGWFMLDLQLGWWPAIVDLGSHLLSGGLVGLLYKQR